MNQTTAVPTGTITFLFTDIEGSTKLWESHPDAMRDAVARHDALLRQAVGIQGGYLFKTTGDGIAAAFALASDALVAALSAQLALLAEPWPEDTVLRSRMGLHTGAAELRDGDYFGPTLNRVARLMAAGHGGQTLLSDVTHELTRDSLLPDVSLLPLGEHRLKDLARPESVFQLAHPALPPTFPPLRTLDVTPNNLPQQVTSFVGREKVLAEVAGLLGRTRLLTLAGSGGSGKTRLSLQAAADALNHYPDGAWLVELAALSDPVLVPQAVATVLSVREQAGQTLTQTLMDYLKSKRLLLVLDNCEHVLAACATLVAALLRACPEVKVIATSREPLQIGGETVFRVPTLSLPSASQAKGATAENLSQFEAVQLFIERAQAVKPDFAVTNANAPALAQICHRLDGIPLALELAAARVRSLSVEQINDKLDSRFRLLTGGDRAALPRQQTLRALIDWSYDLLTDREKTLFARLSVFAGGWMLEAAENVCTREDTVGEPLEDWEMLDLLTGLADKSLVLVDVVEESPEADGGSASRYRMLETIRQYATERLSASGEAAALAVRHRDYFVGLGVEAQPHLTGPEQGVWLNRLESEHDNLRAALDTCTASASEFGEAALAGQRLVGALWRFWLVRGYVSEGREQIARALAARQVVPREGVKVIAEALRAGGNLAYAQGDYAAAQSMLEESVSLFREIEDKRGIASTLSGMGSVAYLKGDFGAARSLYEETLSLNRDIGDKRGIANALGNLALVTANPDDYAAARPLHEESLSLFREIGDKSGVANMLGNLGLLLFRQGDYAVARPLYEESLSLYRETGDKRGVANRLDSLGLVACAQGDYTAARSLHAESLRLYREIGDKRGIISGLQNMASVCAGEGEARRAVLLWSAAGILRDHIGTSLSPSEQAKQQAEVVKVRATMGEEAFAAAWEEGGALSWEQAVAVALEGGE